MIATANFRVEVSEFQSRDEAELPMPSATVVNEPPDDCSCVARCVCGFSTK